MQLPWPSHPTRLHRHSLSYVEILESDCISMQEQCTGEF